MALDDPEYVRERINPLPGDPAYLHLSDLLLALTQLVPPGITKVLDYGCGGSPYRSLFGNAIYHRADLRGEGRPDFEYNEDSKLPRELANYDCVLSTQVLEHVVNPGEYLSECFRVLRPSGWLILTTHGLFEDHACPYDYWRWTAFGLVKLVQGAGFVPVATKKLTTGPRGALFIAERELSRLRFGQAGLYGKALSLGMATVQKLGSRRRHKASDVSFSNHRVADLNEHGHGTYVAIAILASRAA